MRKATILDVYELYMHLKKYLSGGKLLLFARELIQNPKFSVYMKEGMAVILEVLPGRDREVLMHVYIDEDKRGKEFIRALQSLEELIKGEYTKVVFRPPVGNKAIRRLIMTNPKVIKIDENNYEYVIEGYKPSTVEEETHGS